VTSQVVQIQITVKSQYSLFSLGMLTYTFKRQDITQIALERLPGEGGGNAVKKKGLKSLSSKGEFGVPSMTNTTRTTNVGFVWKL
jgi:hypothetical protein